MKPKNMIYALMAAAALGCSDGPTQPKTEPPPNHPPVSSLYVSPLSGVAPLADTVRYSCTDQDNDLKVSELSSNGNVLSSRPSLDTVINLTQNASFGLMCKDQEGNVSSKGPVNVTVLQPSFSQTATLQNSVDIKYTATLENMAQATRKTFRNDTLIDTKTVTGPSYSEMIAGNPKGNYKFVVGTDTAKVNVPDYMPTLDSSGLQTDTVENREVRLGLQSRIKDTNPEDNPHLISATSLDQKTQVTMNEDSLAIKALGDSTGTYKVQVQFGSPAGGVSNSVIQGNIYDLPRASGNFQNSETWLGVPGTMRFYTVNGSDTLPVATQSSDASGNNLTNQDGSFSFKLTKRSSDLENILVMAREGTPGNYPGYVRTVSLPAKDTNGVLIRAVPYPSFTTPDSFKTFMNLLGTNQIFDFNGQYIPGFSGYNGTEILSTFNGIFPPEQQDTIKNVIMDSNGINAVVGNKIAGNSIIFGNQGHYKLDEVGRIIPDSGWIIIAPDSTLLSQHGYTGLTVPFSRGTLEYGAVIYLYPWSGVSRAVLSRELGHVSIGVGEPPIFPDLTIMNQASTLNGFGLADIKAGKIDYNPTFMVSDGIRLPHIDYIGNILRTDFK